MRRLAAVLCFGLIACANDASDDAEIAADSTPPAPAAPTAISAADVQGTWNVEVMPMDRDTVVSTYVLQATGDKEWTITFPGREPMVMHVTGIAGDSITTHVPPFPSSVRADKAQTEAFGVSRLQNGELVGSVVAHYKVTTPDSVSTLRTRGRRVQ